MSGRLVGEALDYAEANGLSHGEVRLLCVLADMAHHEDREVNGKTIPARTCFPGADLLQRRLGMASWSGVRKLLASLAEGGCEVRVPISWDDQGEPIFAARGHGMSYRLPEFPKYERAPETGELSIRKGSRGGTAIEGKGSQDGTAIPEKGLPSRPTKGSRLSTERAPVSGAPNRKGTVREPFASHTSPKSQTSVRGWDTDGSKDDPEWAKTPRNLGRPCDCQPRPTGWTSDGSCLVCGGDR